MNNFLRAVGNVLLWIFVILYILLDISVLQTRWCVWKAYRRVRYFYRDDYEDEDPRRLRMV
jgi:hypothetical protein